MTTQITGFILDTWFVTALHKSRPRTTVYGIGKTLEGKTFGFADMRNPLRFFIRKDELPRCEDLLKHRGCTWDESELTTMDGASVVSVYPSKRKSLSQLPEDLSKRNVRSYEADMECSHRYLMEKGIHRMATIEGTH